MTHYRIILISPAHPLRGGIASSSERLALALLEAGHDVQLISYSLQYPAFLFPGKTQFTDDPKPPGISIETRINSINPFNWFSVGFSLSKRKPDIVIARFWMPFFGPALGTIFRFFSPKTTRRLALVDNIIPHEKRFGDRFLTRFFTAVCDGFIVMSRSVEEEIRAFSAAKPVRYIPHPIYDNYGDLMEKTAARRLLGLVENGPLLLFFGFIRDYKGLDLLLESMADLRLKTLRPTLLVAGEFYEKREPFEALITRYGLENQVVIHADFIPAERVRLYFSAADLVVQPYKTATQSGISQLCFHFEKPMVVTRVGGLAEIVADGKSGYVVEPKPAAIADAIHDFFENNRLEEMTAGVRDEKGRFAWENLVLAIEEI